MGFVKKKLQPLFMIYYECVYFMAPDSFICTLYCTRHICIEGRVYLIIDLLIQQTLQNSALGMGLGRERGANLCPHGADVPVGDILVD